MILAIDPGNSRSGFVLYEPERARLHGKGKLENDELLDLVYNARHFDRATVLAIEMAESFGAKVWDQVFKAVLWTGRFVEAWTRTRARPHALVYRREVKMHVSGSGRARDGQIRMCLLERWGGKDAALGSKHAPGPLHGVTADVWAALAIAVTFSDGACRAAATQNPIESEGATPC